MSEEEAKKVISQVASQGSSADEKKPEETTQLIVFMLDEEEYGIDINELKEIIKLPEVTPVPNTPEFIRGILNLRGKIVVVVDLEKRFNLTRTEKSAQNHVIIIEKNDNTYGIIVDEVEEVLRIPISQIKPVPPLLTNKIHADYLKGVVSLENQMDEKKEVEKDTASAPAHAEALHTDQSAILADNKTDIAVPEKTESDKDQDQKRSEDGENAVRSRLIILLNPAKVLEEKELMILDQEVKQVTGQGDQTSVEQSAPLVAADKQEAAPEIKEEVKEPATVNETPSVPAVEPQDGGIVASEQ